MTSIEKNTPLNFAEWAIGLDEFYAANSREEREFMLTRKLVLATRRWGALVDETIRRTTGYRRAQWQALFAIAVSGGPLATVDLSVRMSISWPSLLRTLRELEDAGLIERETDEQDRRSRLITITPKGREVAHEVQHIMNPLRGEILAGVTDQELDVAEKVLGHILQEVMHR